MAVRQEPHPTGFSATPVHRQGHVADFVSIGNFAIFNVADSAITIGVVVYLVYALFIEPKQLKQQENEQQEVQGA